MDDPKPTDLVKTYHSDPKYLQAKDLFFSHATLADVSRATGVNLKTLKKWKSDDDWELEREDDVRGLMENAFGARKVTIAKIIKTAPELLLKGLEYLAQRPDPLTLDEQVKVSAIIGNLDKISRLDAGKSTENISVQVAAKVSVEDVRKIFAEDPFFSTIVPDEEA